jgi:hypothetical protein
MFFRELSGASKRHLKKWLARANSQKDGVRHDRALSVTAAAAARV